VSELIFVGIFKDALAPARSMNASVAATGVGTFASWASPPGTNGLGLRIWVRGKSYGQGEFVRMGQMSYLWQ